MVVILWTFLNILLNVQTPSDGGSIHLICNFHLETLPFKAKAPFIQPINCEYALRPIVDTKSGLMKADDRKKTSLKQTVTAFSVGIQCVSQTENKNILPHTIHWDKWDVKVTNYFRNMWRNSGNCIIGVCDSEYVCVCVRECANGRW